MSGFLLSQKAIDDLETIWAYIARDNEQAADRVIDAAFEQCKLLAEHSELGTKRSFKRKGLEGVRSFVISDFPNYVIFYRIREDEVQILRVLHGARDIERLFAQ